MIQLALSPRPTSFLALSEIRDRGLLGQMQFQVYRTLAEHGPLTGQELDNGSTGRGRGHLHKRLPELERMGLVEALPARRCRVTGQLAVEWHALDRIPVQPAPRPTRLQAFSEALVERLKREPGRTWTAAELADLVAEMAGGSR
jgi:hypothetical protein